ncbi:unnamed protein product [Phyllotreta striolata]|uniref:C2HC/C3H-type domain-containing protein n=1 Tax=Phyllotreta striolata TaxID=444603 RepID=A0A9P0DQ58_PHYSR|nr:unnamed protein product [Phyllotreta striolata]
MASKLAQMQARFQQKQMQEKEEKLVKLYENQQQRAFDKVGRNSAGSTASMTSTGGGKVRQMFDERRQKAGIDKSYPLEPLKPKNNIKVERKIKPAVNARNTGLSTVKTGKPVGKKKEEDLVDSEGNDIYQSKSHRDIIELSNNHKYVDDLDNEVMPRDDTDEDTENIFKPGKLYTKEKISNNNGITNDAGDSRTTTKSTPNKLTAAKSKSKSKQTSPEHRRTGMGDKPSNQEIRTPSAIRTADKQLTPRAVVARDDLCECNHCGRRFAQERIQKHEEICSKTGKKRRKPYDATKHRVFGTDLESYVIPRMSVRRSTVASIRSTQKISFSGGANKKDWRRAHEEFISTIRAAKVAQAHVAKGGKLSDLPPPPPSSNPDYVQCPHCGRRFNESAAERHIPKCADYQFNKPKHSSKSKLGARK